jgi:hypothetical protein
MVEPFLREALSSTRKSQLKSRVVKHRKSNALTTSMFMTGLNIRELGGP